MRNQGTVLCMVSLNSCLLFFCCKEINKDVNNEDEFSIMAFDSASVTDLLQEFSQTSVTRIAIGYILMVKILLFLLTQIVPIVLFYSKNPSVTIVPNSTGKYCSKAFI